MGEKRMSGLFEEKCATAWKGNQPIPEKEKSRAKKAVQKQRAPKFANKKK